jgi:hypothetical protein
MLKALLLLAVVSVEAQFENCDQSANPLGECECEGQVNPKTFYVSYVQ